MAPLENLYEMIPFARTLGLEIADATPEQVIGTLAWAPERCTSTSTMHGGALMSLADMTGALCAYLNLPEGTATTTVSSATNFLRAVRAGTVTATARPIHTGRSYIVVVSELRDDQGRLVAQVTQTQAVLQAETN
jgi:1,4-dihydroxy-2-naphthoyl-CoA hydrolase